MQVGQEMTNETWGQVREALMQRVGRNNYTTWIEPLRLARLKNGVAHFEVPTSFFGDWVQRNYADHIRSQLVTAGAEVHRIEFAVAAVRPQAAKPRRLAPKAASMPSGCVL